MDKNEIKKYLQLAEDFRINKDREFTKPQIALKQKKSKSDDYSTLGTLGNFSVLIGKAKSRKSFFTGILASAAINSDSVICGYKGELPKEQQDVICFDTEQGRYHVQQAHKRICKLAKKEKSKNLHTYYLRTLKPAERIKIIEAVIYNNKNIGYVIIDGIRDLVTSINDEEQATKISSKLLKWSEERNIHIVVILHQNKGNSHARGHLGTELINKSELVLSVTKHGGNENVSIVKSEYSRDIQPEPFAFTIIDGLPTALDSFVEKTSKDTVNKNLVKYNSEDKKKLLRNVFSKQKDFKYGKLFKQIKQSHYNLHKKRIGDNQAKKFLKESHSKGWLCQERLKGPYTLSPSFDAS